MKTKKIVIKLDVLLKEKNMSKNKLCSLAHLQRTQLNSYCNNKVCRIDISVLERICSALDCDINEIFETESYSET